MRYFGTDGIRGVANKTLTPELAYKIGSYLGHIYDAVIIGKDTRGSSSMLEASLASGVSAHGADVYEMGYTSTPALAYNAMVGSFDCGIMISASHNPYHDNGIKIFSKNGLKISSSIEEKIEDYIDGKIDITRVSAENIGEVYSYKEGNTLYTKWLQEIFDNDFSGLKLVFDLANGGATYTFASFIENYDSAHIKVINNNPNGRNINDHCGSTHLEGLIQEVKMGYDAGFAFDGDADRVLAVDSEGNVIDGDALMYILASDKKAKGFLKDNTLVTTIMSNVGLYKALEKEGIEYTVESVGDKNVADKMIEGNYDIGGEQSGHIIISDDAMFGDGLKTALHIISIIKKTGKSLKELASPVKVYPQVLVNAKTENKEAIMKDSEVSHLIDDINNNLANQGRMLVRPSGTEPLIRIMVEAKSEDVCNMHVQTVLELLRAKSYIEV